jgi:hypothetical protein
MDEPVRFTIEGDESAAPTKRHSDADAYAAAELNKTRHALADAAAARNELLAAKRVQAAVALDRIDAETVRAQQAYQHAWENGDAAKMADSQREIASLEVQRNNAQGAVAQLQQMQPVIADPIEAFAAGQARSAAMGAPAPRICAERTQACQTASRAQ